MQRTPSISQQLLQYRENLDNPPLLVVCDFERWEIHTNWPNTAKKIYRFSNAEILQPQTLQLLRHLFFEPARLHPNRITEQVTQEAAAKFEQIADSMRRLENDPLKVAHFITKLVFCLFAEDAGLLPLGLREEAGVFSEMLAQTKDDPIRFRTSTAQLFQAMSEGGEFWGRRIPYFNGALFDNDDTAMISREALRVLHEAAMLDWAAIEPSIFGTLFERTLDPGKRAQLGAHYTSRADIELIVEPVIMAPLRAEWEAIKAEAAPVRAAHDAATTQRARQNRLKELMALRERMLQRLREYRVLDPACGSGNFLYVALQALKDFEKLVINDPLWQGVGLSLAAPEVGPHQVFGIEKEPIAHALASIVVWIGTIQWQLNNGYLSRKQPVLDDLSGNIVCDDAIVRYDADGRAYEPDWPPADAIIGNPPFLGGYKQREQLGDKFVDELFALYSQRIPNGVDLVCYWFEKARAQLEAGAAARAGLLATNSIRGGINRRVLERIKEGGDIFMAWSDRSWIVEGAAVRVSIVGFEANPVLFSETNKNGKVLDGIIVGNINPDLTGAIDLTIAHSLAENAGLYARGIETGGPFEIMRENAELFLQDEDNRKVLIPILNGKDVTDRPREIWVIDFERHPEIPPNHFGVLYDYLRNQWGIEIKNAGRSASPRENWWKFRRSGEKLRNILRTYSRMLCTPRVAKHRLFVWVISPVVPDSALYAFAREDDYFFGVLHSRLHEAWSLRMGTWLGVGNDPRYTPTTTFETFPLPWPPGHEDTGSSAYAAVRAAAAQLHAERDAWLNPPGAPDTVLAKRTLTNLYNALNVWRGVEQIRVEPAAGDFAPRLDALHRALDEAVLAAYSETTGESWPVDLLDDEDALLGRLLALNLQRARQE